MASNVFQIEATEVTENTEEKMAIKILCELCGLCGLIKLFYRKIIAGDSYPFTLTSLSHVI